MLKKFPKFPKISKIFIRLFKKDKKSINILEENKKTVFERNLIILKSLEEKKIFVYNGKAIILLSIMPLMINKRLGDFCFTKIMGSAIIARKKAKLQKKRKKK